MTWGQIIAVFVLIVAALTFIVPGIPEWVTIALIMLLAVAILTHGRRVSA